ncbi:MAG: TM0106 family RecB-like putative nuclease, partial [Candidatus Eremiobacteraeota bacterium]|nr:TM0106 family RecB-like putative nuclease [Candidatus Eremiobacteraeota bacterium]
MARGTPILFTMQRIDGRLIYSASDLNDFLDCARLSELERAVAMGEGERPERSAQALLIAEKGLEHEQRHLELLKRRHRDVVTIEEPVRGSLAAIERAAEETHQAMKGGAAIIYQGVFFDGTWLGKSDFLLRVDEPSQHWPWSYEVADTKLALSTKPYFIVQLSFYSAQLARVQGSSPAWMHVILGDGRQERYRVDEFAAYVRRLKRRFEADAAGAAESYPWPNDHCNICPWNAACEARRERDDHLTLVARIRRDQIKKLQTNGIQTTGALAAASESERPPSMAAATFGTLHR